MSKLNVIVKRLIATDDSYQIHYDSNIKGIYQDATEEEKEKIDSIFLYLTGYSLETIIKKTK